MRPAQHGDEEGRGVFGHEADLRPVVIEIVEAKLRRGGQVDEAVRHEIADLQEEDLIPLLVPRQAEDVDADGRRRAEQDAGKALERLDVRGADVGEGDHDAEEHDGRLAGGLGPPDEHRGIERQHHAERHPDVQLQRAVSQRGMEQEHQQERQPPERADQGAEEAVDGVISRVAHIGLHADDGGDTGLGRHVCAAIAAQIIDHQAQEDRHRRLDDALADVRQIETGYGICVVVSHSVLIPLWF